MYDRAPRETIFDSALGSTSPNVGPASYNANGSNHFCVCKDGDGYAPFMSLANRDSIFNVPGALLSPGPQHYDINPVQEHIKGGQSMQNKEVRFKTVGGNLPGPGSYDAYPMEFVGKTSKVFKPQSSVILPSPSVSAPSIPSSNHSYGYEEAEDGVLTRHLPPSRDGILGPAYYNPQYNEPYSTRQYKGVHFGNRTSKRIDLKIPEGPGPGTYDLLKDHTIYCENLNMRNNDQKYESYVPRYLDAVVQEEEKKGFPGPAKYEIKSLFDEKTSPFDKFSPGHPPFLSQTKRFLPVKSITPAPGWYDDPRTALQSLKRISTKSKSPFGHNAARFVENMRTAEEPGPGSYNITHHTLAQESQRKANFENPIGGGFGSTAPRLHSAARQKMPGPADYKIQEKGHHFHRKQKTSSFASMTARMPVSGTQNLPAPGSYDVHRSYERTQSRGKCASSEFMCNSFLTTVPRNVKIARQSADKPGPGAYKPILKSTPKLALIVSRQPRFKDQSFRTPGPADYELSPVVMDTVLKGTFNATLINPLLNLLPVPTHPEPPLFQDI
ncbi:sperm-tail PG-rich repeat-containing protein 2 [Scyliorhinus canicula]|uniref:sperm-tail PG-rich repeat-containing protein 2 n=1 Tax=Scyliorhinus canicula TaxID=7830 RepID=UPI0018F3F593|nr:sperm-tail PG-rich repeat-containing protein 2 [Scyliorhinus canicula]XP_038648708.1 sperm-tail PG-rich repeat-containing protein 2 [Scyliorhinus canicula]XP_038648710.1 sperm-tail PG-rich repeat-containing protein 2 [Scyliorhinus canicula]XP_038648711.1 sperm-tail PG-rich repeat-containing protein 2 [Scyliorhinus canicula]XP_038648712.1 sperm-tail PG-rich repeat-containing protein 2 [Scyliorhinus canicula]XP_038648713.1 sperm-tail PG-rich repeat-containing protein 2 [Scyliorhinus canicula]